MNWPKVKLGELMRKTKSISPSRFPDSEFCLFSVPSYDLGQHELLQGSQIGSTKTVVKPGDVLISKIVPHIPRVWVVTEQVVKEPLLASQEWIVLNDQRFNPEFLRHYLLSAEFRVRFLLTVAGVGGSLNRARPAAAKMIEIPLPPLEEQKRISAVLEECTCALKSTEVQLEHLELVKNRLLSEIVENSDNGELKLSDVADITSGITKGRKAQLGVKLHATPYMAVSNVKDGFLDLRKVKEMDITATEIERFALSHGDILLTEGGDPDKLGRGTIWHGEVPGAVHQNHIFRARIKEDSEWIPEALSAVLSSIQCRKYFLRAAKQTTGIASINKTQLSMTPIKILSFSEQQHILKIVKVANNQRTSLEQRQRLLKELLNSLAQRAFSGVLSFEA